VVATNVGGVADVLENGALGRLVTPDSEDEFAAAVLDLAGGDGTVNEGRAGPAAIHAKYGIDRLVRDVERLYDGLLRPTAPQQHRASDQTMNR
jgi:glycosyltransferase involved in cell wall biosynthesis